MHGDYQDASGGEEEESQAEELGDVAAGRRKFLPGFAEVVGNGPFTGLEHHTQDLIDSCYATFGSRVLGGVGVFQRLFLGQRSWRQKLQSYTCRRRRWWTIQPVCRRRRTPAPKLHSPLHQWQLLCRRRSQTHHWRCSLGRPCPPPVPLVAPVAAASLRAPAATRAMPTVSSES